MRQKRGSLTEMGPLLALIWSCLGGCGSAAGALTPVAATAHAPVATTPPQRLASAAPQHRWQLAHLVTHTRRGALWSHGATLVGFEFDSATNVVTVGMPREETIRCAVWSDDGGLLAAVSAAGSTALWARDGTLLAEVPGESSVEYCSDSDFRFSAPARRVVVTVSKHPGLLLGPSLARVLHQDSVEIGYPTFSPDAQRLFAAGLKGAVRVFDADTGDQLAALSGTYTTLAFSEDGASFALEAPAGKVALYAAQSLAVAETVPGTSPAFHSRLLVVALPEAPSGRFGSAAYSLRPFAKRWERVDVAIFRDAEPTGAGERRTPWRVGMGKRGHAVFDVRSGQELATWNGSGYGCGYEWVWDADSLLFVEGSLVTFWQEGIGAETHRRDCRGALMPVYTRDRERVIALDTIWDTATRRPLVHLDMEGQGSVAGFSPDEQLVVGMTAPATDDELELLAWSASTGDVVWRRSVSASLESTERLGWYESPDGFTLTLLDVDSGDLYRVANAIDARGQAHSLVLSDRCWASPDAEPGTEIRPPLTPARSCPELYRAVRQMIRARTEPAG